MSDQDMALFRVLKNAQTISANYITRQTKESIQKLFRDASEGTSLYKTDFMLVTNKYLMLKKCTLIYFTETFASVVGISTDACEADCYSQVLANLPKVVEQVRQRLPALPQVPLLFAPDLTDSSPEIKTKYFQPSNVPDLSDHFQQYSSNPYADLDYSENPFANLEVSPMPFVSANFDSSDVINCEVVQPTHPFPASDKEEAEFETKFSDISALQQAGRNIWNQASALKLPAVRLTKEVDYRVIVRKGPDLSPLNYRAKIPAQELDDYECPSDYLDAVHSRSLESANYGKDGAAQFEYGYVLTPQPRQQLMRFFTIWYKCEGLHYCEFRSASYVVTIGKGRSIDDAYQSCLTRFVTLWPSIRALAYDTLYIPSLPESTPFHWLTCHHGWTNLPMNLNALFAWPPVRIEPVSLLFTLWRRSYADFDDAKSNSIQTIGSWSFVSDGGNSYAEDDPRFLADLQVNVILSHKHGTSFVRVYDTKEEYAANWLRGDKKTVISEIAQQTNCLTACSQYLHVLKSSFEVGYTQKVLSLLYCAVDVHLNLLLDFVNCKDLTTRTIRLVNATISLRDSHDRLFPVFKDELNAQWKHALAEARNALQHALNGNVYDNDLLLLQLSVSPWYRLKDLAAVIIQIRKINFSVVEERTSALAKLNSLSTEPPFSRSSRFPRDVYVSEIEGDWMRKIQQLRASLSHRDSEVSNGAQVMTHKGNGSSDVALSFWNVTSSILLKLTNFDASYERLKFEQHFGMIWVDEREGANAPADD